MPFPDDGSQPAPAADDALRAPIADEWEQFATGCNLRDMGTHVCALPTGEHCSRGLVCLGSHHAQPKKSAAPVFRRMITSHTRSLDKARKHWEPAGQLAARELELDRLRSAPRRAEDSTTAPPHSNQSADAAGRPSFQGGASDRSLSGHRR